MADPLTATATVFGRHYTVHLRQADARTWLAWGDYDSQHVEGKGVTPNAAVQDWRMAATVLGN